MTAALLYAAPLARTYETEPTFKRPLRQPPDQTRQGPTILMAESMLLSADDNE
jgi:hypothetical protein